MIPGPVVFGALIDKSCILWQHTCGGDSGVCLLFNTALFRLYTYGVTFAFELLAFLLSLLLLYFVSHMEFPDEEVGDEVVVDGKSGADKHEIIQEHGV